MRTQHPAKACDRCHLDENNLSCTALVAIVSSCALMFQIITQMIERYLKYQPPMVS